mmetsp:Transcript_15991/g.32110  ORF Transcript_15991/g.32110 Transcript_15991/m.32110 type:complete len:255 (+) Transcript_15991:2193-2957(+)
MWAWSGRLPSWTNGADRRWPALVSGGGDGGDEETVWVVARPEGSSLFVGRDVLSRTAETALHEALREGFHDLVYETREPARLGVDDAEGRVAVRLDATVAPGVYARVGRFPLHEAPPSDVLESLAQRLVRATAELREAARENQNLQGQVARAKQRTSDLEAERDKIRDELLDAFVPLLNEKKARIRQLMGIVPSNPGARVDDDPSLLDKEEEEHVSTQDLAPSHVPSERAVSLLGPVVKPPANDPLSFALEDDL